LHPDINPIEQINKIKETLTSHLSIHIDPIELNAFAIESSLSAALNNSDIAFSNIKSNIKIDDIISLLNKQLTKSINKVYTIQDKVAKKVKRIHKEVVDEETLNFKLENTNPFNYTKKALDDFNNKIQDEVFEGLLYPDLTLEEYLNSLEKKRQLNNPLVRTKSSRKQALSSVNSRKQIQSKGPSKADDIICQACNDGDYEEDNLIVICAKCNISVHQKCYKILAIPINDWICNVCLSFEPSQGKLLKCSLCPIRGGAMKQTTYPITFTQKKANDCKIDNEPQTEFIWVHLSCSYWLAELGLTLQGLFTPQLEMIDIRRFELICSICKKKRTGYCAQCSTGKCQTAFHVECARLAGLHMEFVLNEVENGLNLIFCERHKPLKLKRDLEVSRKRVLEDIMKFSNSVNKCMAIAERQDHNKRRTYGSKKAFSKQERKLLLSRIKFISNNYYNLTLDITLQKKKRANAKVNPYTLRYADTVNRRLFPWNEIKIDSKFNAENYFYEYLTLIPDEKSYKLQILELSAEQVEKEEQNDKIRIKEEKLLQKEIAFDRQQYCYCKKMIREPGGPLIGNLYIDGVECSGGKKCPGNGWYHIACIKETIKEITAMNFYCEPCKQRFSKN